MLKACRGRKWGRFLHTPAAASLRPRHPSSIEPRTSFLPSEYCLTAQTVLPWIFVVFLFLLSRSLPLIDIFAPDNCHISSGGSGTNSFHSPTVKFHLTPDAFQTSLGVTR